VRAAIFLDRDGVLNQCEVRNGKPYAPRRLEDFHLFPDVAPSVERLRQAGYLLVVATNQPDIGNGLVSRDMVDAFHAELSGKLGLTEITLCPHRQDEGCDCRKPKPGMLVEAARRLDIELSASYMVGDRAGDVAAGKAAGCRTIFIDRAYEAEPRPVDPDVIALSLAEAVDVILTQTDNRTGTRHGH